MNTQITKRQNELRAIAQTFNASIQANGMIQHCNEDIQQCIQKHKQRWEKVTITTTRYSWIQYNFSTIWCQLGSIGHFDLVE